MRPICCPESQQHARLVDARDGSQGSQGIRHRRPGPMSTPVADVPGIVAVVDEIRYEIRRAAPVAV